MTLRAGALTGLMNQPTAQVIDGSVRFDGNNQYLSRSFGSGNRKKWTWACWVKRYKQFEVANYGLFSYYPGSGNGGFLRFSDDDGGDTFRFYDTGNSLSIVSKEKFRDIGWYHIVIAVDTTQTKDRDRVRRYVNGVRQLVNASNTWPSLNDDLDINQSGNHYIGRVQASNYGNVSMSNNYFIDGQQFGPGYFGFTDPLTNTWRPRKFRAVGTTINDGTVWSSLASVSSGSFQGSYPATNGFNGTLTSNDRANGDTNGSSIDLDFSGKNIIVKNDIAIWSGKSSMRYSINGGEYVSYSDATEAWKTILFSGRLLSLKIKHGSDSEQPGFSGLAVDGVTMLDSTTTNLDFGTNGFYLPMENADDFEIDKSGKGNNWTKTNFNGTSINPDVLKDSPSGAVSGGRAQTGITTTSSAPTNYCTLNPNDKDSGITLTNGNLDASTSSTWRNVRATMSVTSGKYYFELFNPSGDFYTGIADYTLVSNTGSPSSESIVSINHNGYISQKNTTYNSYGSTDVVGVALDADIKKVTFYKNGSVNDANSNYTYSTSNPVYPFVALNSSNADMNFGQKPFKYAPPQGFLPLNSASVTPETVITKSNQYVGITTWSGDNADPRQIDLGMAPDLIWVKTRNQTNWHWLSDSLRGTADKRYKLYSNSNNAQDTAPIYGQADSFNDFGFVAGGGTDGSNPLSDSNQTGTDYVCWSWKAGGSKNTFNVDNVGYSTFTTAPGLNSGTIPLTGCSVGTRQGFSILKYTGSGSNGTLAHGLSQAPDFFFGRDLEDSGGSRDWIIYHKDVGNTARLKFTDADISTSSVFFQDTSPTNSLITIGTSNDINSTNDHILYCFHNVPGLQKFGRYKGTNDSDAKDGPFAELGFRPALVAIKRLGTGNWIVYDIKRDVINPLDGRLYWNLNSANVDNSGYNIDFYSNGFKITGGTNDNYNASSDYVYAAWAEAPTINLYGGQSNSR